MIPERIGGTVEANAKDKGRAHNGGEEDAVSSGKGVVKGAGQTHRQRSVIARAQGCSAMTSPPIAGAECSCSQSPAQFRLYPPMSSCEY